MRNVTTTLLALVVMAGATLTIFAAEDGWDTALNLGLSLTDGNSETSMGNLSLIGERGDDENKSLLGIEGNYGETGDETTAENVRAWGSYKRTLNEGMYGYLDATALYDKLADVDYRFVIGPGIGYFFFDSEDRSLGADAGLSYLWEDVGEVRDDYLAIRFGQHWRQKISETARIWQALEYLPRADDFGDYLINFEIGAEAAMNSKMNLRLVFQDRYDSTPAAGREENDLQLIAGFGYTL